MQKAFITVFILAVAATMSIFALTFHDVMTPEEMDQTGVSSLTSHQRKSLEKWLTNWSAEMAAKSSSEPVLPRGMREDKSQPPDISQPVRVVKVYNGGKQIQFDDGSVWDVFYIDLAQVSGWLPRDKVSIEQTNDYSYPFFLKNMSTGTTAKAKPVERAQKEPDTRQKNGTQQPSQEMYEVSRHPYDHTQNILKIEDSGGKILLEDGSLWEVAPSSRFLIQKWDTRGEVYVDKLGELFYPYRLVNKKTGDYVLVKYLGIYKPPKK